jgi:hypothetical protein
MPYKTVAQMKPAEVVAEAESLCSYMESCREIGQGFNSKEIIRFNQCMDRIEAERLESPEYIVELHVRMNPRMAAGRDMMLRIFKGGCTTKQMQAFFAPA